MKLAFSRLAWLVNRFATVAGDWGLGAAWGTVVTSRRAGRHTLPLSDPPMRFHYRGRTDHTVLSSLFCEFGFIDAGSGPPVRTIIDAGANIGIFTVIAKRLWPQARIVALEIDEGNFELLESNARQLEGVTALNRALWDSEGELEFVQGEGAQSHSVREYSGAAARKVRSTTVEAVMAEHGFERIDILKMDIEGAEGVVVESLSPAAWSRINAIIFECNDSEQGGAATRALRAVPPGEFDAFAFGENLYLIRRSTGWTFRRRAGAAGALPRRAPR